MKICDIISRHQITINISIKLDLFLDSFHCFQKINNETHCQVILTIIVLFLFLFCFLVFLLQMHWNFDMYIRTRVDTSPTPVAWSSMCKQLFGFIGFMLFMFYLGHLYPVYQPVVSTNHFLDSPIYIVPCFLIFVMQI